MTEYHLPALKSGGISGPEAIVTGTSGTIWYIAAGTRPSDTSKIQAPANDTLVEVGLPTTFPAISSTATPAPQSTPGSSTI